MMSPTITLIALLVTVVTLVTAGSIDRRSLASLGFDKDFIESMMKDVLNEEMSKLRSMGIERPLDRELTSASNHQKQTMSPPSREDDMFGGGGGGGGLIGGSYLDRLAAMERSSSALERMSPSYATASNLEDMRGKREDIGQPMGRPMSPPPPPPPQSNNPYDEYEEGLVHGYSVQHVEPKPVHPLKANRYLTQAQSLFTDPDLKTRSTKESTSSTRASASSTSNSLRDEVLLLEEKLKFEKMMRHKLEQQDRKLQEERMVQDKLREEKNRIEQMLMEERMKNEETRKQQEVQKAEMATQVASHVATQVASQQQQQQQQQDQQDKQQRQQQVIQQLMAGERPAQSTIQTTSSQLSQQMANGVSNSNAQNAGMNYAVATGDGDEITTVEGDPSLEHIQLKAMTSGDDKWVTSPSELMEDTTGSQLGLGHMLRSQMGSPMGPSMGPSLGHHHAAMNHLGPKSMHPFHGVHPHFGSFGPNPGASGSSFHPSFSPKFGPMGPMGPFNPFPMGQMGLSPSPSLRPRSMSPFAPNGLTPSPFSLPRGPYPGPMNPYAAGSNMSPQRFPGPMGSMGPMSPMGPMGPGGMFPGSMYGPNQRSSGPQMPITVEDKKDPRSKKIKNMLMDFAVSSIMDVGMLNLMGNILGKINAEPGTRFY